MPTTVETPPDRRAPLVLLGIVVSLAAVWLFGQAATGTSTGSYGTRVDTKGIYNPVSAGEPLPDGFRQLLPRDAILPIYDPIFVAADDAGWEPGTDVIGVRSGDEAKAYPVSFLSGRELVIDEIDGIPILVSW